jgi:hypothetical protein
MFQAVIDKYKEFVLLSTAHYTQYKRDFMALPADRRQEVLAQCQRELQDLTFKALVCARFTQLRFFRRDIR